MKKLIFYAILALSLFTASSCTKEVGGNADMSTVNFNVQSNEWMINGTPGEQGYGYYVDLSFPEITNNVIQNGMVTLYMKRGDSWTSIPFNYFYRSTDTLPVDYEGGYFYSMKQGMFSIDYYESDHYTVNPGSQSFRLVIVQPR
jgi:hypothetical protein